MPELRDRVLYHRQGQGMLADRLGLQRKERAICML
jgi:hypothetical protein